MKENYKDEIIDEMQTNARVQCRIVFEDAIRQLMNQLSDAGVPKSAILLSVRVMYHDIIDELNDEEEN